MWGPFFVFAIVNSFTPGPNVIMLASSGGAFGLRRTLPHLLGVCFGLPLMLLMVVFGSEQIFKNFPWVFAILTLISLAYVSWLALRIFRMGFGDGIALSSRTRPMNFVEAALYQWVNGKAWQIVLMIVTLFSVSELSARLGQASVIWLVTFAAGIVWIELGKRIASYLEHPTARRVYYSFLSVALLISTWPKGISQLISFFKV